MRIAHGNGLPAEARPTAAGGERGSVAVPLLLLSVVLGGAAISSLGYALLWRSKAALQLRLDRCVENAALELVVIQNAIEAGNLRMRAERAAAQAAAVPTFGASIADVQPVLAAEVAAQEFQRARWRIRQAKWILSRGCDGKADAAMPLPNLAWARPVADAIGPRPLEWEGRNTRIVIRLWKTNRFSQARVARGKETENENASPSLGALSGNWSARWVPRTGR